MAGKRTRFRGEYNALRPILIFYCRHLFGNFFIRLLPANDLPFATATRPGAFHWFNNPVRVVYQANTAAPTSTNARALLRGIRVSLDKNCFIINHLSLNWTAKGTHFTQTRRQGCFPFNTLWRISRQCARWETSYCTGRAANTYASQKITPTNAHITSCY